MTHCSILLRKIHIRPCCRHWKIERTCRLSPPYALCTGSATAQRSSPEASDVFTSHSRCHNVSIHFVQFGHSVFCSIIAIIAIIAVIVSWSPGSDCRHFRRTSLERAFVFDEHQRCSACLFRYSSQTGVALIVQQFCLAACFHTSHPPFLRMEDNRVGDVARLERRSNNRPFHMSCVTNIISKVYKTQPNTQMVFTL